MRSLDGRRVVQHVLRRVDRAAGGGRPAGQHRPHQLDRLVEPVEALAEPRAEVDPERGVLGLEPGAADPEAPSGRCSCGRASSPSSRRAQGCGTCSRRPSARAEPAPCSRPRTPASGSPRTSARTGRRRSGRRDPTSRASRSRADRRARPCRGASRSRCTEARRARRASRCTLYSPSDRFQGRRGRADARFVYRSARCSLRA